MKIIVFGRGLAKMVRECYDESTVREVDSRGVFMDEIALGNYHLAVFPEEAISGEDYETLRNSSPRCLMWAYDKTN